MAREVPERWKPLMDAKGLDSYRGLALRAGIAPATVIRLLNGEGAAEWKTVEGVAEALGISANEVLELHGTHVRDHGPMDWPDEARLLTPRQREAVVGIIRSMVEPETAGGRGKTGLVLVEGGPKTVAETLPRRSGAARTGDSKGRELRRQHDLIGEENQDPDGGHD